MTVENILSNEIDKLGDRVLGLLSTFDGSCRIIVSVSGIPGSGKSTVTEKLMKYVCERTDEVVLLPQDGFHLYRHELDKMDNAAELVARRGAPFTFNTTKFSNLLQQVKYDLKDTIYAPDFSHQLKDPQENKIVITPAHKIVILEGNYVNLADNGWQSISDLASERWMVVCDFATVKQRIINRHLKAGISKTRQEATIRAETNDLVNAKFILNNSLTPDVVIQN